MIDILLGVLDEGRLTDAKGRFCDFSNTIVILTSNLGVKEAIAATEDLEQRKQIILKVVQGTLRPELYNRLGAVVPFNALDVSTLRAIVTKNLRGVHAQLQEAHKASLLFDDEVVAHLATLAYDPAYGARPVERTVDRLLLADLSRLIIGGSVPAGSVVRMYLDGEELGLLSGPEAEVIAELATLRASSQSPNAASSAASDAAPSAPSAASAPSAPSAPFASSAPSAASDAAPSAPSAPAAPSAPSAASDAASAAAPAVPAGAPS